VDSIIFVTVLLGGIIGSAVIVYLVGVEAASLYHIDNGSLWTIIVCSGVFGVCVTTVLYMLRG
jgi:hypothetical protein